MQGIRLAIFFSVFFIIFSLISYYIFIRGWQGMSGIPISTLKIGYIVLFVFFSFSYLAARIAGKHLPLPLADTLATIGGFWFAAMLYFILLIVLFDIVRITGNTFSLFPGYVLDHWDKIKEFVLIISIIFVFVMITMGYFNANNLRVNRFEIDVQKSVDGLSELNIVVVTDIHLGHVIDAKFLNKIITGINNLNPDLVLFPGDIVDEDLWPVIEKKLGEPFLKLKPRFGVWAVTGNHEYIGGEKAAVSYLSRFGIKFLRDEVANCDDLFYIVGREDITRNAFTSEKRKPLTQIVNNLETNRPVILMDHQPVALAEAAEVGIDLQVSGHTHHGQMWPLNYITRAAFKLSWGYKKIGSTHFYVSSGAGTWGPRVRIGSRPEIVLIRMNLQ